MITKSSKSQKQDSIVCPSRHVPQLARFVRDDRPGFWCGVSEDHPNKVCSPLLTIVFIQCCPFKVSSVES